jgi:antitoxin VapB
MPLHIRDADVDALATELQALVGARTKTEAVRRALKHEIDRTRDNIPLRARLEAAVVKARAMGPGRADFDMKRFTDEMWGE